MEYISIELDTDELRERTFVFDRTNPNWVNNPEHNLFFLHGHQNMFNDLLRARGHVFLNDILDLIGFPRTVEGNLVGWALSFQGPVYIEFKLTTNQDVENSVGVQFNFQGYILDQLYPAHAISVAQFEIHNQGAANE